MFVSRIEVQSNESPKSRTLAFRTTAWLLLFFSLQAGRAVNGTWDSSKSGYWTNSANWLDGIIAEGAAAILTGANITQGGVTRTITLNEPHTIGSLAMWANGKTYQFSGTGTITLQTIGTALIRCVSGGNLHLDVPLAGNLPGGIRTPDQTGTVWFNRANTFSGDVSIYRGRVKIGNASALPHGGRTGKIELVTGGNPSDTPILDLMDFDITINGLSSNTNYTTGTLPLVTTASSNGGTNTLTIGDNDANATFDGVITNGAIRTIAVTKIGTGTQSLRGNNSHTGVTTVNAGTLAMDGTSVGPVTVNGGLLRGVGAISNTVTVHASGNISGGGSPGILRLDGLDLGDGGTNIWELAANSDSNPGIDFDQIDLQGFMLDLTNATLSIHLIGSANSSDPFWMSPHTWSVITSPGTTGDSNFKTIQVLGGTPAGTFSTVNNGTTVALTFTPGAVPFHPPVPTMTSVVQTSPTSVTINYSNTLAGTNYVVQYQTNLNTTNWIHLSPVIAGDTTSSAMDTLPAHTEQRFYRVYGQF